MSIAIISDRNPDAWIKTLNEHQKKIEVEVYPDISNKNEVEYALVWNHPQGVFKEFPNIKVIASMGAGVDHIMQDPELPENVKVIRIVDEQLAKDMAEFVLALVLNKLRNLSLHHHLEQQQEWKPKTYQRIDEVKIGIMGIGELGSTVSKKLTENGFSVSGWANSKKDLENIKIYAGQEELDPFLAESDILICLLPLTPDTENILNKDLFKKLPENAFLINVARGNHLVENDLIEMIDSGHLSGAALDVFRKEPLPEKHPFWKHPKIQVTPHIASVTKPSSVVSQILENYERMKNKEELQKVVDKEKGY
ncbi:glyoxylate/hydroxypyruvate reductase A [Salinimicrobium marinum]|uniref:Glyoxylate/hydroxypyruvate reductase A n=1 Tax=Salinimicrobium marinum TaxID=680283 RepID=A0A918VVD6_9FLAO|nr:glyoxylate/hydroxypyruvate reductase A [Salinimicrobium marinum]GHA26452.1 glyoxylate/hydroxypyruvate reductase A [Salinimicrobium marinum]